MLHRLAQSILVITIAISSAACLGQPPPGVEGRTFLSTAIATGGVDRPLVPGTRIRLVFGADGRLMVSAGCNSIGGTYRLDGQTLRFGDGAMTDMGCDPALHDQDEWVSGFLGAGPSVSLSGGDLVLSSGDTVVRLLDREIAEPDLPLVGRTWTVVAVVAGDAVSSIPDGIVATLEFDPDGQVRVATGCNVGSGRVVVDAQTLRFTDLVLTKRACDRSSAEMESAVVGVLEADAVRYRIEAGTLSLSAGAHGLELTTR